MKRQPTGKRIELSPRDIEIFELLTRYRYLRSTYIHAFVRGASETRFKERLGDLYHEGGYLERPKRQWDCVNARYMPLVYENTPKAMEFLHASGGVAETITSKKSDRQFAHTLLTCEILASIELAARDHPGLRFISSLEILAKAPRPAAASPHPLALPISEKSGSYSGERALVPDGLFGLEYLEDGMKSYRFFALELDCGTMPLKRSGYGQSSYAGKISRYRRAFSSSASKTYWGVPNLFVLTVTNSNRRLAHMLGLMKDDPCRKLFLFKDLSMASHHSSSNGMPLNALLETSWERAGHAPLSIMVP